MATAVKAERLRLPGKQSSGGSGRAEQFSMGGKGIFTARNSLRQDDFTARQRCRQGRAVIFGCMGSHNARRSGFGLDEIHGATQQRGWSGCELRITFIALHNQIYIVVFRNSIHIRFCSGGACDWLRNTIPPIEKDGHVLMSNLIKQNALETQKQQDGNNIRT